MAARSLSSMTRWPRRVKIEWAILGSGARPVLLRLAIVLSLATLLVKCKATHGLRPHVAWLETSNHARGELRILATWIAPYSVKACGRYLMFWPRPGFKITDCDLESAASSRVRRNMKSSGKRS